MTFSTGIKLYQYNIFTMDLPPSEIYISIDVETAGPNPGLYSLLSIGACVIDSPEKTFYVELKPVNREMLPDTHAVHGLSIQALEKRGLPPAKALARFESWLEQVVPGNSRPVFVAFNAPFDWMFVCDYFHRFLGRNPFGHTALDIKAYAMGLGGTTWGETSMAHISKRYLEDRPLSHHALQDAIDQAEIFRKILENSGRRIGG
jgi:DNA polymerase III epsilon subunit-like protein